MTAFNTRVTNYSALSSELSHKSNEAILSMLNQADDAHTNDWGGCSWILTINGQQLFVKKIPLTQLENIKKHHFSTRNLFNLPTYYQYGIGSSGFGAWRELAAHQLATNWVLSNAFQNFPLLYEWRIMNSDIEHNRRTQEEIDEEVSYWENNDAIRCRLESINDADSCILLFLEYFPCNLHEWIQKEINSDAIKFGKLCTNLNQQLFDSVQFMREHGFLHMDAHFRNLLTDGQNVYFSDFGLALSNNFDLTTEEKTFFHDHKLYDNCSVMVNFSHSIVTSAIDSTYWEAYLKQDSATIATKVKNLEPGVIELLQKYFPVIKVMDNFYMSLQYKNKNTRFPKVELSSLLENLDGL